MKTQPVAVAFKRQIAALALGVGIWAGGVGTSTAASSVNEVRAYHIQAQALDAALKAYALQAGREIFFAPELTSGKTSNGVSGSFDDLAALKEILAGTGLTFSVTGSEAILVKGAMEGNAKNFLEGNKNREETRVAAEEEGSAAGSTSGAASKGSEDKSEELEEIVVTAQKRVERLQDVPVPVTAVNIESLVSTNQVRLEDYYAKIPGLNVATDASSQGVGVSIRGISSGTYAAVGVTIDDVPYVGTSFGVVPEIDPNDLERIEVLRGPQGTLYGASSMGGLIKYITRDPSSDRLSGDIRVGASSVENGNDLGYNLRGAANVPVSDTFAVRTSGYTRTDPGYVDDPAHGLKDTNEATAYGGRLTALWKPSGALSVKFAAMLDENQLKGGNVIDPTLGDYTAWDRVVPGFPTFKSRVQFYSAAVNAKLGHMDLMSLSSYSLNKNTLRRDITSLFGSNAYDAFPQAVGVLGVLENFLRNSDKITQEIRLSVPLGERIVGRLGGFYQNENIDKGNVNWKGQVFQSTGELVGIGEIDDYGSSLKEHAVFADLTFQITDRFDLEVGGRQSHIQQHFDPQVWKGVFVGPNPVIVSGADSKADVFTYLLTPRFKISPDLMLYTRFASGYRPGGPNILTPAQCPGCPGQFGPDKTKSYEAGVEANLFQHKFSLDASLYSIDWVDLQTNVVHPDTGFPYLDNVGKARSQGLEVAIDLRPLRGLTIGASGSWNDTHLTEFPPLCQTPSTGETCTNVQASVGDQAAFNTRFTGNISVDQQWTVTDRATVSVGGSLARIGRSLGPLGQLPSREEYGAYTRLDLYTGVNFEAWTANLYVNNLTNKLAKLSGTFPAGGFQYTRPRTVGFSLTKNFGSTSH